MAKLLSFDSRLYQSPAPFSITCFLLNRKQTWKMYLLPIFIIVIIVINTLTLTITILCLYFCIHVGTHVCMVDAGGLLWSVSTLFFEIESPAHRGAYRLNRLSSQQVLRPMSASSPLGLYTSKIVPGFA